MHKIMSHSEPNGRTTGHVGFGTLDLFECDECGCVVSDPDLHMERVHPDRTIGPEGDR